MKTKMLKPKMIYLSERQQALLGEIQKMLGISISEIIRRAIDEYIEREKTKNKNYSER
tara:strand:- start:1220 stop:1393 length:174 start_codon:yes stop_codon:yes gene_type:complete